MYKFFVPAGDILEDKIIIRGEDVNHILNVLRMHIGDQLLLSAEIPQGFDITPDASTCRTLVQLEYLCDIAKMDKSQIICNITDRIEIDRELPCEITLFQGMPKGDKLETIIQKAVELGVGRVVPVIMSRSISRPDERKSERKLSRYQEIARAAAKQSKRGIIPAICSPISMKEALEYMKNMDILLVPYEEAEDMEYSRSIINNILPGQRIGIAVGPEGGFEEREIEAIKSEGGKAITLGPRILRTETAAMTLLAWLGLVLQQ